MLVKIGFLFVYAPFFIKEFILYWSVVDTVLASGVQHRDSVTHTQVSIGFQILLPWRWL